MRASDILRDVADKLVRADSDADVTLLDVYYVYMVVEAIIKSRGYDGINDIDWLLDARLLLLAKGDSTHV